MSRTNKLLALVALLGITSMYAMQPEKEESFFMKAALHFIASDYVEQSPLIQPFLPMVDTVRFAKMVTVSIIEDMVMPKPVARMIIQDNKK